MVWEVEDVWMILVVWLCEEMTYDGGLWFYLYTHMAYLRASQLTGARWRVHRRHQLSKGSVIPLNPPLRSPEHMPWDMYEGVGVISHIVPRCASFLPSFGFCQRRWCFLLDVTCWQIRSRLVTDRQRAELPANRWSIFGISPLQPISELRHIGPSMTPTNLVVIHVCGKDMAQQDWQYGSERLIFRVIGGNLGIEVCFDSLVDLLASIMLPC